MSFTLTHPPDPTLPDPTADLLRRVGLILFGLVALITRVFWNSRHAGPFWSLWNCLGNAKKRLDRIAGHLAAGTKPRSRPARPLRALRPSRSGPPSVFPGGPPLVQHPGGYGWLVRILGHHGAYYTVQFENLLHEPFAIAYFAANPAVASILRPIWHMLAVHPLLLPPRPPRRPRKTAPAPAPVPAPQLPPSAAPPAPVRRRLPRLVLDAITPTPRHVKKPA